jgi:uncharacterized Zn-binding protein involved in type VI secretion
MPAAARKSDKCVPHCSPFTIATGSADVFTDGKAASRVGDTVTSHKTPGGGAAAGQAASIGAKFAPPPYSFALMAVGFVMKKCTAHGPAIATGSSSVFINGKPAAFVGSSITGCTSVSAGSQTVFIGR